MMNKNSLFNLPETWSQKNYKIKIIIGKVQCEFTTTCTIADHDGIFNSLITILCMRSVRLVIELISVWSTWQKRSKKK